MTICILRDTKNLPQVIEAVKQICSKSDVHPHHVIVFERPYPDGGAEVITVAASSMSNDGVIRLIGEWYPPHLRYKTLRKFHVIMTEAKEYMN